MLGDRFVVVPAEAMFRFLEGKGFIRTSGVSRREVVYERRHHVDPRYVVLVYTSIAAGQNTARRRGGDAIRVVAIREGDRERGETNRGVAKTKRVFRTGTVEGVLARTLERMREAYAAINERVLRRQPGLTP
jgi:hypothetical protein